VNPFLTVVIPDDGDVGSLRILLTPHRDLFEAIGKEHREDGCFALEIQHEVSTEQVDVLL